MEISPSSPKSSIPVTLPAEDINHVINIETSLKVQLPISCYCCCLNKEDIWYFLFHLISG